MAQNRQPLTPLEITVANLIEKVELQPESVKPMLAKLKELRPMASQVSEAIVQTQNSLKQLYDNENKIAGSFETIMSLLEETMPADIIEKHGKKLEEQPKPPTPDAK